MKSKNDLAEDYINVYFNANDWSAYARNIAVKGFLAGYDAREKSWLEAVSEFDEQVAINESLKNQWAIECPDCGSLMPDTKARIRGARYQHSIMAPQIAALKEESKYHYENKNGWQKKCEELHIEKQNILKAWETDSLRMAELKEENQYLKERLKRYESKFLGRP
jgi:hypothetical protein